MADTEQHSVKSNTWKLFTAAVIFALLAGVGTMIYLKVLEHRLKTRLTPAEKEMTHVIVATGDFAAGSTVNASTMAVRAVPKEYVNDDVFTPEQFDSIKGAILIKPLKQGKMLSAEYIDRKIPKDFSGTIQVGHRAVTIQVDEINSISGMIRPGNYIDLFTRLSADSIPALASAGGGEVVIPVMEDVLVLATDQDAARANEDEFKHQADKEGKQAYNALTLEVTPEEAALIAIAESRGNLIAALRNAADTSGLLFDKVSLADLVDHSGKLAQSAADKQHNRKLDAIQQNSAGQLVTPDGVVITDPNVHLNKDGLLVTNNGTVLSGRGLTVDQDGHLRTADGKLVDTGGLVAGQNGTLVDKDGTVLDSNGYTTVQGGFVVDKDGHVITNDGNVLQGVTVGKDGLVRTADGRVINADQITVDKDGKVRIAPSQTAALSLDKDGKVVSADGKPVKAADLVTVAPDGTVRTKDGKVLAGVTMGKDGELYTADGKKMTAADVLTASQGFKPNADGTVTDESGKVYAAKDLVTVGQDGTVRTKDGTVLPGAYIDKDGKLKKSDGTLMTAQDVFRESGTTKGAAGEGEILAGVTGRHEDAFAGTIGKKTAAEEASRYAPYEVEYIIGGGSDGAAKTFKIEIKNETNDLQQK